MTKLQVKFYFSGVLIFLGDTNVARAFCGVLGLLIYFFLCLEFQPYINDTDDLLINVCVICLLMTAFLGLMVSSLGRRAEELPLLGANMGMALFIFTLVPWITAAYTILANATKSSTRTRGESPTAVHPQAAATPDEKQAAESIDAEAKEESLAPEPRRAAPRWQIILTNYCGPYRFVRHVLMTVVMWLKFSCGCQPNCGLCKGGIYPDYICRCCKRPRRRTTWARTSSDCTSGTSS